MDDKTRNLIFKVIDQTIAPDEFDRIQDAIEKDDDVRAEYVRAVALSESLREIASGRPVTGASSSGPATDTGDTTATGSPSHLRSIQSLVLAAVVLFAVGGAAFWLGQQNNETINVADRDESSIGRTESQIAGHAILRRSVDLKWSDDDAAYRDGDVLTNGRLRFNAGVAEIDFFCGATLIVEGPAVLEIESDWSVEVSSGRLRANVPPAARGFIVKAAGSQIVDLGTEFALEVQSENARLEVIDGEVEIRGGQHDGNRLLTGQRQWLKGTDTPDSFTGISTLDELIIRRDNATSNRFAAWQVHSHQLRQDDRLIAYFPIAAGKWLGHPAAALELEAPATAFSSRVVRNAADTGDGLDGKLVGPVEQTMGRFGPKSSGLEFGRPGSRVRTRIDGEFKCLYICVLGQNRQPRTRCTTRCS